MDNEWPWFCQQGPGDGGLVLSTAAWDGTARLLGKEGPTRSMVPRAIPSITVTEDKDLADTHLPQERSGHLRRWGGVWDQSSRDVGIKFASCATISEPQFPHLKGGGARPPGLLHSDSSSIWGTLEGGSSQSPAWPRHAEGASPVHAPGPRCPDSRGPSWGRTRPRDIFLPLGQPRTVCQSLRVPENPSCPC